MKKRFVIFVFGLFSLFGIQLVLGQNSAHYILLNKGDSLRYAGDMKGAILAYQHLLKRDSMDAISTYNLACIFATDKQLDSCFNYLHKAILLDTTISPLIDKDFYFARQDTRWNGFENKLIHDYQIKSGNEIKNVSYAIQLFKCKVNQMAFEHPIDIGPMQLSMIEKDKVKLNHSIDPPDQNLWDSLLQKNGYPKISEVGMDAAEAAFYLIENATIEMQKKYLEPLKWRCIDKEAVWQNYATLVDRILVSDHKPQKYGTQYYLTASHAIEFFLMEDTYKVNACRKEIGLVSMDDYLRQLQWQFETKIRYK